MPAHATRDDSLAELCRLLADSVETASDEELLAEARARGDDPSITRRNMQALLKDATLFAPGVHYRSIEGPETEEWQDLRTETHIVERDYVTFAPWRAAELLPRPMKRPVTKAAESCARCLGSGETETHGVVFGPNGSRTSIRIPLPCPCQKESR